MNKKGFTLMEESNTRRLNRATRFCTEMAGSGPRGQAAGIQLFDWRKSYKKFMGMILVSLLFSTLGIAAPTVISSTPIESSNVVPPNIILGLDDSGSMDWELLLPNTQDGSLWWHRLSGTFLDNNNNYLFGATGGFTQYNYLFPNGTASDAMVTSGSEALPPFPQFAFARCSTFNPLFYNPAVTYKPWSAGYIDGANVTFPHATGTAARSHPYFPTSGTPTTTNLTVDNFSQVTNFTFRAASRMVIPGATISGISYFNPLTASWVGLTTDLTVPLLFAYRVAVPYIPATYYVVDSTCTAGPSCATAPDGRNLRQYIIQPGNTFPSGRTYADEIQNFANWFTYYRKRKLHVASAMSNVLPALQGMKMGLIYFNSTAPFGMVDIDSSSASENERVILGYLYKNPSSGGTPTRRALVDIGNQYVNNTSVIQYGCQQNAAMILTDGFANGTVSSIPSYSQSTWGSNQPYSTTFDNSLADIALAYYTINLRPDLPAGLITNNNTPTQTNYDANTNLHMNTYAVTLAIKGTIFGTGVPEDLNPFTSFPNWPNPGFNSDPTAVDDLWHATINGRGRIFNTPDITSLTSQILTVFTNVLVQSGAGSAVGLLKTYITNTDNVVFLATYIGSSGNLKKVSLDTTTGNILVNSVIWDAQTLLDSKSLASRIIASYTGSIGVPFEWANLTSTQQTLLNTPSTTDGQDVLAFLRGNRSKEGSPYRVRAHVLGDIVYSEPVAVAGALASYPDTGYAAFANSIASRVPMVYQGANDGMLHAFNIGTGQEAWAYIPNAVFSNLNALSTMGYTHKFYVDGTPTYGDVYISGTWKTLLVGGLRSGGNGYYALDITNPSAVTSQSTLASTVLWEFPNASTPTATANNVGLSFGKPILVKTNAAGWVVLVTSGYNNTAGDGKGHLFVLNPSNGAVIADLNTQVGSASTPSGLAHIAAFSPNANTNGLATQVYGGDLLGNFWRFDLSDNNVSNWNVKRIATLVDSLGTPQPITTEPEIGLSNNQRMIYVGTGILLGTPDLSNTQQQTMYALVDNLSTNPTITSPRTQLAARTISGSDSVGVAYSTSSFQGWYLDFPTTGERLNTNPLLAFGTLIFNTNIPSPNACSASSYQYALDLSTGLTLPASNFPTGTTPWARRLIGNTLSSRPSVILLSSGQLIALTHQGSGGTNSYQIPQSVGASVSKVAWKEILTQ